MISFMNLPIWEFMVLSVTVIMIWKQWRIPNEKKKNVRVLYALE